MSESEGSDVLPTTRSLIIATAGHVDHGKTSLVNHITGINTDTLAEEKTRGLTINLGYAYHHFHNDSDVSAVNDVIGFVDVPGHTDFINNMLAGVSSVDAAMLVVAADDGIMPQTREHLAILDLLGISCGLVALTKSDRCDKQRIDQAVSDIQQLLSTTSLKNSPIFTVSNLTGEGIPELVDHLHSLLTQSENSQKTSDQQLFRYLIDRSFSVKGIGTVVTGSVRSGTAKTGSTLLHTGSGELTRLKGLRQDTLALDQVHRGQRAAANLGLSHHSVKRGDWLVDQKLFHPVNRFDANIRIIDEAFKLRSSAQYHLHIGASHHVVTLRSLDDKRKQYYQIKSHEPLIAHFGDRFVIRDPAAQFTIGGGQVIDILVPRRGRSGEHRIEILAAMDQDDAKSIKSLLQLQPGGVDLARFALGRNVSDSALNDLRESLVSSNIPHVALHLESQELPVLLHNSFFEQYSQQILDEVGRYHKQHSNQQGISEPALSKQVDFSGSHILFHAILQNLIKLGTIKRTGTLLHLPSHETSLTQEEKDFMAKVRPILMQAGNIPPRTRELVELTRIPLKPLERILHQTTKAGNLIRVADNRHYLPETIIVLAELTEKIAAEDAADEGFSVIQFRDTSGIGRNLCIEILEYFDRIGFTRREGNSRFVRTDKENIFGK